MEVLSLIKILLIDDDPENCEIIEKSLKDQMIKNELFVAYSCEEAFDYLLRSKTGDKQCPKPDLILLDLNIPGMGGKGFLKHVKADSDLDTIPVIVLSKSDSEQDVHESYDLGAAGHLKKPITLQGFKEIVKGIEGYWLAICK